MNEIQVQVVQPELQDDEPLLKVQGGGLTCLRERL